VINIERVKNMEENIFTCECGRKEFVIVKEGYKCECGKIHPFIVPHTKPIEIFHSGKWTYGSDKKAPN